MFKISLLSICLGKQVTNKTLGLGVPSIERLFVSNARSGEAEQDSVWGLSVLRDVVLDPDTEVFYDDDQYSSGFSSSNRITCFK